MRRDTVKGMLPAWLHLQTFPTLKDRVCGFLHRIHQFNEKARFFAAAFIQVSGNFATFNRFTQLFNKMHQLAMSL